MNKAFDVTVIFLCREFEVQNTQIMKRPSFFFIQHYTYYYSLFSPNSECAKYTFEWLFRHYYSKIISDFFVSQKHRKFRIVLRGNLIKHKPALHNSLISEEWCADAIVISKINQSTTNWKQTNLNFSHILHTTYVSSANSKLFSIIFMLQCINKLSKTIQFL